MALGRPTKYLPEYCDLVIEHCSKGYSFDSFAGLVKVNQDTIYEWAKVYPDFSEAKAVALEAARLHWEKLSIEGLPTESTFDDKGRIVKQTTIPASVWVFSMKNRFSREWSDRIPVAKEQPNTTVNIAFDPSKVKKK